MTALLPALVLPPEPDSKWFLDELRNGGAIISEDSSNLFGFHRPKYKHRPDERR